MRTSLYVALCAALFALAACQREAAAPELGAAEPKADAVPATGPAPGVAPVTSASAATDATLMLMTSGVPQPFVADASSRTLYYIEGDMDGSKCTGPCREAWPPVLLEAGMPGTSGALTGAVAVIDRADGGRQVTYNGHPLYRYGADAGVGRMAGHGVNDQWGQWHALAADGSPLPKIEAPPAAEGAKQ